MLEMASRNDNSLSLKSNLGNIDDNVHYDQLKIHLFLLLIACLSFVLRALVIGKSGFHEDEIEKAIAVQKYKELNFSYDPEHPALMKLMMVISTLFFGDTEFAIRLPNIIIGSLTVFPIYYVGKQIHSEQVGLIASTLWAFNVTSLTFSTIAKEDSFMTFFGTSAIYYYLKYKEDPKYLAKLGVSIGLAMASKYTSLMFLILISLFHIVVYRRKISVLSIKRLFLKVGIPAFVVFFVFNFPLLIPSTLQNFQDYVNRPRIHSGHLIMGETVQSRPYSILILHILVKYPVFPLIMLLVTLVIAIVEKTQMDKLLLIWAIFPVFFYSFTPFYGRNTRYYHVAEPAFMLVIAVGILRISTYINSKSDKKKLEYRVNIRDKVVNVITILFILNSLIALFSSYPYYRMYVNELGGGEDKAGYYFPQDSVFDYELKEAIEFINLNAPENSSIAIPTIEVGNYYGRSDLTFVDIGQINATLDQWSSLGFSYAIVQSSRTYFENENVYESLRQTLDPVMTYVVLGNTVVEIYQIL